MMHRNMGGRRWLTGNFDAEISGRDLERGFINEGDGAMKGIEDLLSPATVGDHVIDAEQSEMVADGGLRKPQLLAK